MTASRRSAEQQGFEAIGRFSESGARPFRPFIDRLFARRVTAAHLDRDWASDADWARLQQDPLRARAFLYVVLLAVAALIAWSAVAAIDEVTRGVGRVIPSSQLQKVQSFDGGVVQEILVEEGDRVAAGELLMRIDPTRFLATFRENRAKAQALEVRAERLRALVTASDFTPSASLREEAPGLVARERELYESSLEALAEQRSILEERLAQRRAELDEARSRRDTASRELGMASQELNLTRPLLETGAVSEVEVLRLQREVSRASGERTQAAAQVERLQAAIEEAQAQLREVTLETRNDWRNELSRVLGDLAALDESGTGLQDRVRLAEIRSPVDGVVQRLGITTLGGVVQPGQEVVDIVPSDDALLVDRENALDPLATFSKHDFFLDELTWPSVEHYFQGMKFNDPHLRRRIALAHSPHEARRLARRTFWKRRRDWKKVQVVVMTRGVYLKCRTHPDVGHALLQTGDRAIVESSLRWTVGKAISDARDDDKVDIAIGVNRG